MHVTAASAVRRSASSRLLAALLLWALAAAVLYPLLTLLAGSLKSEGRFIADPVGPPWPPVWQNYLEAWKLAQIPKFTLNSLIVTVATVGLTLLSGAMAGFALSRLPFRGHRWVFLAFVLLLTLPVQVYIIPLYVLIVRAHLADNLLGLILPYTASNLPLAVFLFKTYFDRIPGELLDAARLDGCTPGSTFLRVILPLSKPVVASVAIFAFVQAWNEFFLALVFIHNPDLQTLPLGLQAFFVNQFQVAYPQLFATLVLSIAPIAAVYLLLQRQFMAGLTAGAVKG